MSDQQSSSSFQNITIHLEVVPEDKHQLDIADIDEVGQSLVDQLRNTGYTVNPAYSGRRGVPLPGFDILLQIPQFIHDNRELLFSMFDSFSLTLQCLLLARERQAERKKGQRAPLEFILEVNDKSVTINAYDVDSGMKLLERFQSIHPEEVKKVTLQSSIKIKATVPKKKRRHPH